ncbi:MAG: DedA family protein [Aquificae bacterium]|nr:DedA family protein [Aquificota bacterium]
MLEGLIPQEWIELAKEFVREYGYLALFVISFTEAFINPIVPYIFIAGAHFFGLNIWVAALVAFVGNILGAAFTYFLGCYLGERWGKKVLGEKLYSKGELVFQRYGFWAVIVGEPFKLVCWLGGIFRMEFVRYMIAQIIARGVRIFGFTLLVQLGINVFSDGG